MASAQQHPWTYREVDTAIISLWPLLKHHNWTYRDLMNVVRQLLVAPKRPSGGGLVAPKHPSEGGATPRVGYPCRREQDFAVHCRTVLGLRKNGRGKTTPGGHPPGYDIAQRIFAL